MEASYMHNGRLELLTGGNYYQWMIKMRAILRAKRLYKSIIEGPVPDRPGDLTTTEGKAWIVWEEKNDEACSIIILSLAPDHAGMFADECVAQNIWKELEKMYSGNSADRIVDIMLELKDIKMNTTESVDHYILRAKNLLSKIQSLGGFVNNREFVFYVVRGINEQMENVAVGLRTRRELSLDEVHTILREEENRSKKQSRGKTIDSEGAYKSREDKGTKQINSNQRRDKKCYICKKQGHIARNCWFKKDTPGNDKYKKNNWQQKDRTQAKVALQDEVIALTAGDYTSYNNKKSQIKTEYWNLDSGCTVHMTSNAENMFNIQDYAGEVQMAESGRKIKATMKGQLRMDLKSNDKNVKVQLHNVLYVPKLKGNLMSVRELVYQGNAVTFNNEGAIIYGKMGQIVAQAQEENGMYTVIANREGSTGCMNDNVCQGMEVMTKFTLWHRRLGHVNEHYMKMMKERNIVIGLNYNDKDKINCNECTLGKMTKQPFKPVTQSQATKALELIHMDLCGPLPVESLGGKKYIMAIIDTYTKMIFIRLLKYKNEAYDAFVRFKNLSERKLNTNIKRVRSDNGLEFINAKFEELFVKSGIHHERTIPHNPQSNGLAERTNRTLLDTTRTLLIDSGLPTNFWGEAVHTAVYVRNRSYRKTLDNKSPKEMWDGRKTKVYHLRIFGSLCHYWLRRDERNKLQARAQAGIFIGYSMCRSAYRIYVPNTGKIVETRDVKFQENVRGSTLLNLEGKTDISESELPYITENFIMNINKSRKLEEENEFEDERRKPETPPQMGEHEVNQDLPEMEDEMTSIEMKRPKGRPEGTRKGIVGDRLEKEKRAKEELMIQMGVRRSERLKERDTTETAEEAIQLTEYDEIPKNYSQAINSKDKGNWLKAMQEEINSLNERKVWKLIPRTNKMRVIKNRWVFAIKGGNEQSDIRYKARLVAMGNKQREGIDYNQTYAPVMKYESLRLLLALAAQRNMDIHRYDVKTAYLYGELEEEIYMEQPIGMEEGNQVCKLLKSIYGLPQSGHNWNKKLNEVLTKIGFRRLACEPSIYIMEKEEEAIYLGVYVDDLILIESDKNWMNDIIGKIKLEFEIREEKGDYLGIEICKVSNGYSICQEKHIDKLLKLTKMEDCNLSRLPADPNQKLDNCKESKKVDNTQYQEIIGSLLYIANGSRPDISYATNKLSHYCNDPREIHLNAAKKVIKYLKGTKKKKLYIKDIPGNIELITDASWCSDKDCKSQTGYCVKLGNSTINWKSRKQELIAMSTCEAEVMAICEALKELEWIRNVLQELNLGNLVEKPTKLYTDSRSAMDWSKSMCVRQRTKHFNRKLYKIREEIENNKVELIHKPGKEIEADILTKSINIKTLEQACENLGMK